MQPYLFPYLGYFQLINAVDEFVLGDVLQYEKESWINRNRILVNGRAMLFSFPLKKDRFDAPINQRQFADGIERERERLLKVLRNCYSRAPNFSAFYPVLEEIIEFPVDGLADYAENSLRRICRYAGITTPIRLASELRLPTRMDKQERVVQTVKALDGGMYVNPSGGAALYQRQYFLEHGLQLRFHRMGNVRYRQFREPFTPHLSIIDVLMFNDPFSLQAMLDDYRLVEPEDAMLPDTQLRTGS
jgi:hypothetical protein